MLVDSRTGVGVLALMLFVGAPRFGSSPVLAQESIVLSKQIAVAGNEASLRLELASGISLHVALIDDRVLIDAADVGSSSEELEASWRALLGEVVALEDGPLVRTLTDWSPPNAATEDPEASAARIDDALEEALRPARPGEQPLLHAELGAGRSTALLGELLGRPERLVGLAKALEGLRLDDLDFRVAESVTVVEDETIDATLVVVDGELDLYGVVEHDVVAVGSTVRLHPGSLVRGDLRLLDARLARDAGAVRGVVLEVEAAVESREDLIRESLREELRAEIREMARSEPPEAGSYFAPLRHVARGLTGIVSNLFTVLGLGLVGAVLLYFGGNHLEAIAETARRAPGRSAIVGIAGTFLALPTWILGTVALLVSLIGIPVALAWIPLFPIAVTLAAALGYYAVALNVGAWIARRDFPHLGWVRVSNSATLVSAGVLGLMAAFIMSNVVEVGGPWLGFLQGLFATLGVLATIAAMLVGFGAVLITRAGRRPQYYPGGDYFDQGWDEVFDPGTASERDAHGGGGSSEAADA